MSVRTLIRRFLKPSLLVMALVCVLFGALPVTAQFDTGSISGVTVDPSGAVVPNASVTVTNTGTGAVVNLKSNSAGAFSANALPSGTYDVSATAQGFGTVSSRNVVLNVGSAVRVALKFSTATASETVTVTGTQTSVNTETTVSGSTFTSREVSNLPINGRDVSNFLEISPGSVGSTGEFQGSVNGLENIFSGLNITLDGQNATRGDITGYLNTEGQQQSHVTRASIDSIQEINFANNGYTAETGHSLGPQMNIITKGGTNSFHGTLFEFFRNEALDAHDYFERGRKQPLRLNQFGGNLSGPVFRDKLFFFMNYEGARQHLTNIQPNNHTLSAYVRSQFVPSMQPVLAQLAPLPAGCNVIPTPASCAYSTTPQDAGGPQFVRAPVNLSDTLSENTGSFRMDYNMSNKDSWMVRYNVNDSQTNHTYGPNVGQLSPQALRTQLIKVDETHVFSPGLLNQFSLAYNRFYSDNESNTPKPYYSIAGFFTDLGSLPGAQSYNQINSFNTYELFDNATKVLHNSTLKFGTQIRANRQVQRLNPLLSYQFASISDLEHNAPFVLQKIGYNGSLSNYNYNYDFYVQYNWHITPKLSLNAGVRYDYNTAWREARNHIRNFDIPTQTFLSASRAPYSAPALDIAPRIGLAYDPFGNGKTVFHAYAGLFYLPMTLSFNLSSNIPEYATYSVNAFQASFAFPSPPPALPAGTQVLYAFPQAPKDPNALNWLVGVEQALPGNFVTIINYSANRVNHQQAGVNFAAINMNPTNPYTGAQQNYSAYGSENYLGDVLGSNYQSLQAQLRRTYHRLNTQINYTWSHEFDDQVNVFSGFANPFDPRFDRSSGDIDVRSNFTASVLYDFADMHEKRALERALLGGWQMSSIVQARSGLPVNVTLVSGFFGNPIRPNRVAGQNPYAANINWGGQAQNYNVNAFAVPPRYDGTYGVNLGNLGRNALRGPAFFQWDYSLMKNFAITEKAKLQFRTDLFNILNHPNFSNPDGGICLSVQPAAGASPASCTIDPVTHQPEKNPTFGVVSSTVATQTGSGALGNGTSRQIQFSAKVLF